VELRKFEVLEERVVPNLLSGQPLLGLFGKQVLDEVSELGVHERGVHRVSIEDTLFYLEWTD